MKRDFIEKIYKDYYKLVKTVITYSIHTSNTDDITSCTQEIFLIAMKKEDLESYDSPKAWFLLTAKNV